MTPRHEVCCRQVRIVNVSTIIPVLAIQHKWPTRNQEEHNKVLHPARLIIESIPYHIRIWTVIWRGGQWL